MLVRFLTSRRYIGLGEPAVGEEKLVPDELGKQLIEQGFAEEVPLKKSAKAKKESFDFPAPGPIDVDPDPYFPAKADDE